MVTGGRARENCEGAGWVRRGGMKQAQLRVVSALLLVAIAGGEVGDGRAAPAEAQGMA